MIVALLGVARQCCSAGRLGWASYDRCRNPQQEISHVRCVPMRCNQRSTQCAHTTFCAASDQCTCKIMLHAGVITASHACMRHEQCEQHVLADRKPRIRTTATLPAGTCPQAAQPDATLSLTFPLISCCSSCCRMSWASASDRQTAPQEAAGTAAAPECSSAPSPAARRHCSSRKA